MAWDASVLCELMLPSRERGWAATGLVWGAPSCRGQNLVKKHSTTRMVGISSTFKLGFFLVGQLKHLTATVNSDTRQTRPAAAWSARISTAIIENCLERSIWA